MTIKAKRERRYIPIQELRSTKNDAGENVIAGYAVVYNSLSEDIGFRETVAPGAFTDHLATKPDVRCLYNHDNNYVLGRTLAGTLDITDDAKGLFFRCSLPDTTFANDLAVSIARGDISQCSFGFVCDVAEWTETPTYMLRTITKARLFDVSPVCFPSYDSTSVSMRSLFPDGDIDVPAKADDNDTEDPACACDCPECVAGDCAVCSFDGCDDSECRCQETRNDKALAAIITRRLR